MTQIQITLQQLRGMIGQRVRYHGNSYLVIEVLERHTELVLQILHNQTEIQADQHGDARRRVPTTLTIPVLTADQNELHPAFLSLDLY